MRLGRCGQQGLSGLRDMGCDPSFSLEFRHIHQPSPEMPYNETLCNDCGAAMHLKNLIFYNTA